MPGFGRPTFGGQGGSFLGWSTAAHRGDGQTALHAVSWSLTAYMSQLGGLDYKVAQTELLKQ